MKFGVFLPTFLSEDDSTSAQALRAFAQRAEELGFDSLWVTDHLLRAERFYSVAWLESLTALSFAAAVTSRIQLGTSVLVLPIRNPVILAKEMATLHYLSAGRFIMGVGVGWYDKEFEAVGTGKSERGRRTDEVLAISSQLLRASHVTYEGEFYRVNDLTIEPRLDTPPPVWVAGGSQLAHELSPERPEMNPRVLDRIVASDGWIARVTVPPALIEADIALIRARLIDRSDPFVFAHENFVSIDRANSDAELRAIQEKRFARVLSDERPWSYIDEVYLTGNIDRIQGKVEARRRAGVDYMTLHTVDPSLEQLELIAKYVVEPFRD